MTLKTFSKVQRDTCKLINTKDLRAIEKNIMKKCIFFLLYKEYEIPRLSKHFLFFSNTVGQKILKSLGRKKRQLGKSNK